MSIDTLTDIFRDVFEDDSIALRPETQPRDIKKWNSLNHINLMIAIEGAFGVTILPQEVERARDVGELVRILQGKGCDIAWP